MERVSRVSEIRDRGRALRAGGARIGFVPTMGALHEGHLRLIDVARREADAVVMSVFVNPLQFGPKEDFTRYPRDLDGDAAKAESRGADLLFAPGVDEMYPAQSDLRIEAPALSAKWEGAVRPGHFAGVLSVVAKLFHMVLPDVALFGRKDLQQAALVRRMVTDLDFPLRIVVVPTVREHDGLAMSSRNAYLSADDRQRALALVRSLREIARQFANGEHDGAKLSDAGKHVLSETEGITPDYLAVVDPDTLEPVAAASATSATIVAARVGSTRLIDNMILGQPE
jgi:pantoate--beta-alanine ligase